MKLYSGTTKRIFKKKVGKYGLIYLNQAKNLKVGDLLHTCRGYNQRIAEIHSEHSYRRLSTNSWYICDFHIVFEDGNSCSWNHCCSLPYTKEQITNYWKNMTHDWFKDCSLSIAAKAGKDIVNENGELLEEFKNET